MKKMMLEMYRELKKNIRRLSLWERLFFLAVLFVVIDDLTHRYAVHTFENTVEHKAYAKIKSYVDVKEDNASITTVSVSTFLTEVKPENDIYFASTKNGTEIVTIDKEKISVVKALPSVATVSAVESKLIDKHIEYEWLMAEEPPKSMLKTLITPSFLLLLFYGGLGYIMLVTSGINPFSKEFEALYPEKIKGSFDDLIGYEDIKEESRQLLEIISKNNLYAEYGIEGTFNIPFQVEQVRESQNLPSTLP